MKDNHPPKLQEAALDLYEACKAFVAKVEANQARSVRSYAQMRAAIAKADGAVSQDGPAGEIGFRGGAYMAVSGRPGDYAIMPSDP